MKEQRPPYPLIRCKDHPGDPLPGYVVCVHAVNDPKVKLAPIDRATSKRLGAVLCVTCAADKHLPVNKITTACAHSVLERFGVPL